MDVIFDTIVVWVYCLLRSLEQLLANKQSLDPRQIWFWQSLPHVQWTFFVLYPAQDIPWILQTSSHQLSRSETNSSSWCEHTRVVRQLTFGTVTAAADGRSWQFITETNPDGRWECHCSICICCSNMLHWLLMVTWGGKSLWKNHVRYTTSIQ